MLWGRSVKDLINLSWVLLWTFSPICWGWNEKGKVRLWDSPPSWWLDCCTSLLRMVVIFKFFLLYWVKKLPLWYQLYCRIPSSPTDCVQQQRSSRRFLREFADWLVEAAGWGLSFIINQLNACYYMSQSVFSMIHLKHPVVRQTNAMVGANQRTCS